MAEHRIILANSSRLLREMLHRILRKTDSLNNIREISAQSELPDAILQEDADWLIMSVPEGGELPEWAEAYLIDHPSIRILTLSPDCGRVRVRWLERQEEDLVDPTLGEIILILKRNKVPDWEVQY